LENILDKLYRQIEEYNLVNDVEVIVSNNASSDNTDKMIKRYASRRLIYQRHDQNIGPDRNFFSLFPLASGEFTWLLGDDDNFTDDILKCICDIAVRNEDVDYIYLRARGVVSPNSVRAGNVVSPETLFSRILVYSTFMSSQVIRTNRIKKHMSLAIDHFGDLMAYYYLFVTCLGDSRKCYLTRDKKILMEDDNTGGYNFYQVWGRGVLDVFKETELGKNPIMFRKLKHDLFVTLILPITYANRLSIMKSKFDSDGKYMEMAKYFGEGPYSILFALYDRSPRYVLIFLNFFLRLYKYSYRVFNKVSY